MPASTTHSVGDNVRNDLQHHTSRMHPLDICQATAKGVTTSQPASQCRMQALSYLHESVSVPAVNADENVD